MGRKNFLMKGRLLFVLALEFRNFREGFINSRVNNTLSLTLPRGRENAKDVQANAFYSPLLLSILHGEGAEGGRGYY